MAGGGSKPGERRGGRQKGTPNKATADVKALAQKHGPAAIAEAVRIMKDSESDQARMSAINCILDRAYGKATQPLSNDPESGPFILQVIKQGLGA